MLKRAIAPLLASFVSLHVSAGVFNDTPDILVCSIGEEVQNANWRDLVFYLSGTQQDGATLYKSLTSNPVLISVDSEGIVHAPKLADCHKQTVEALRKAGRAKDFGK